jgi:hypothetical protein
MKLKFMWASCLHMLGVPMTGGAASTSVPRKGVYKEPCFALLRIENYFA